MTAREDRLDAYMHAAANRDVLVGADDCYPWVLGWASAELGCVIDFPPYATRADGQAIIARAGGIVTLAEAVLAPFGLAVTDEPQLGDIGIIDFSDRQTAVIFLHGGHALARRENRGVRILSRPRHIAMAWTLPDRAA